MKASTTVTALLLLTLASCSSNHQGSTSSSNTITSTSVAPTSVAPTSIRPDAAQAACQTFQENLGNSGSTDMLYTAVDQALESRDARIVAAAKKIQDNALISDNIADLPNAMVELIHACRAAGFLPR